MKDNTYSMWVKHFSKFWFINLWRLLTEELVDSLKELKNNLKNLFIIILGILITLFLIIIYPISTLLAAYFSKKNN